MRRAEYSKYYKTGGKTEKFLKEEFKELCRSAGDWARARLLEEWPEDWILERLEEDKRELERLKN